MSSSEKNPYSTSRPLAVPLTNTFPQDPLTDVTVTRNELSIRGRMMSPTLMSYAGMVVEIGMMFLSSPAVSLMDLLYTEYSAHLQMKCRCRFKIGT